MKNIISLILIALSVAIGFFYISPEYANITALRAQKVSYEDAIKQAKQVKTVSDGLLQKYNSISDTDKAKLSEMMPATFDLIKFTEDLNAIATKYGMTVKAIKASDQNTADSSRTNVITQTVKAPYKTIAVSFGVSGTYPNFINFLKDVENNTELTDLKVLHISGGSSTGGNLSFDVTVNTYALN